MSEQNKYEVVKSSIELDKPSQQAERIPSLKQPATGLPRLSGGTGLLSAAFSNLLYMVQRLLENSERSRIQPRCRREQAQGRGACRGGRGQGRRNRS